MAEVQLDVTKEYFLSNSSEIFLFKEGHDGNSYTEVKSEDDADCIRAIIKAENIPPITANTSTI